MAYNVTLKKRAINALKKSMSRIIKISKKLFIALPITQDQQVTKS